MKEKLIEEKLIEAMEGYEPLRDSLRVGKCTYKEMYKESPESDMVTLKRAYRDSHWGLYYIVVATSYEGEIDIKMITIPCCLLDD